MLSIFKTIKKMSTKNSFLFIIVLLCIGIIPTYAYDQYESIAVGETKTFYFPSEVTSRSGTMYGYNCYSDHINNIEVVSYTATSVKVRALAYTQYQVHITLDYWWTENSYARHDTHMIYIDMSEEVSPDSDPSLDPNDYLIDYGCWGTINIVEGEYKTLYSQWSVPNPDKVVSIDWTRYKSWGYNIISKNKNSCVIEGDFPCDNQKLWCLMKYGNASYKAYFRINVSASSNPQLSLSANPASGTIDKGTKVYLTAKYNETTISGADIYYTLDGSTPSVSSTKYTTSGIIINESSTLKAIAHKNGYKASNILTASYTVNNQNDMHVGDEFTYTSSSGYYTMTFVITDTQENTCNLKKISINSSSPSTLVIPSSVNNYKVTGISEWSCQNCNISSLSIPSTVKQIGRNAFSGCTNLSDIQFSDDISYVGYHAFANTAWYDSLPNGLVYIGKALYEYKGDMPENTEISIKEGTISISPGAFYKQTQLKCLRIPKSVKIIEHGFGGIDGHIAFDSNLSYIWVDEDNPIYDSRNNCNAIIESKTNVLICGSNNTVIPNSVKTISHYAFYGRKELESISIPNSVQEIQTTAFGYCDKLRNVSIGSSVNVIDAAAFSRCPSLERITVSEDNVTYDSRNNCNAVIHTKDNTLVHGCKSTIIPEDITSIAIRAFKGSGVSSIRIPNQVRTLGNEAFMFCNNLQSVRIGSGVTSIGTKTFEYCPQIQRIYSCIQYPFTIEESVFYVSQDNSEKYNVYNNAILYVPQGSLDRYYNTTSWNRFENIIQFDPTEIENVLNDEGIENPIIYSISGQRQTILHKGINIVNGQKVVIK